jgi:bifunctional non-homologous end joining protein LigD
MGLDEYRRKRDFQKTSEPRGKRSARANVRFTYIIQKHDASHLHYDFRLEWNGVLKSWAVPKGPDLDPAIKRLAMQVEDHPLEYGGFEGTIPEGEYGGGTVMLWDKGTWEPLGEPAKGFRDGHLKFILHGEKLQGAWMLVRKGGRKAEPGERHWFLFKERDEFARPGESITEEMPLSVTTGRNLDEIAEQSDRVWGPSGEVAQNGRKPGRKAANSVKTARRTRNRESASKGAATEGRRAAEELVAANGRGKHNGSRLSLQELLDHPGVRRARLPKSQMVELATLVDAAPPGDDWLHEIKFDGYRMLCRLDKGKARFISRNGRDWTERFPELADAAGGLAVNQAILDGEVVSLNADGTTSFQSLQNVFQTGRTSELAYYVFDILHVDGHDLTNAPLEARKEILQLVVPEGSHDSIRYSDSIQGSGQEVIDQACHLHLEGIVSKRRGSRYRPGRGLDWLKVKCSKREEFVIGGFTKPSGSRSHFGALLVGYYDHARKLIYAGRVGTGFSAKTLGALHRKLTRLVQPQSPYSNLSGTTGEARDVSWVKPVLVAEVEFSNWTDERLLRHPSFQGLREDKPASTVIHDEPLPLSQVKAMETPRKAPPQKSRTRESSSSTTSSHRPTTASPATDEFAGVRLTHPDKVLYPGQGITKLDLASYYSRVAEWMLPNVVDRPLAIVRCPAGSGKPCFFQKHPGEGASEHLRQINISAKGPAEYHLAIEDVGGLISLVQMGVLEIHVWGSRAAHLEMPDRLIFDLDPDPAVSWPQVIAAARQVRVLLEELGLTSFLKTTGSKGLHLVVPVQPRTDWDETKSFCRAVADFMVRAEPERFVATMSKAARKGKIFIDYLRNGRGATAVAPYSTRTKPGATVSAPIAWEELTARLHSDHFTIENLPARLGKLKKDPWADIGTIKQSITAAMLKRLAAH